MDTRTVTCFRNVEKSVDICDLIEAKSAKLRRFEPRLMRCRVILDRPRAGHRNGNGISALVRAVAPGVEAVGRAVEAGDGDESCAAAIAKAFGTVERQLLGRAARAPSHRATRRGAPFSQGIHDAA